MSWSKLGFLLALVLTGSGLGSCGYTPLYGTSSAGGQTSEALSRVSIAPIAGMVGLEVRTGLLDHINPNGEPSQPLHRLEIKISPSLSGLLVQPDSAITRYNYTLIATYQLIDLSTSKVVDQGSVTGTSAYNVVTSEYATVVARQDAERRAASAVSDGIALRVALYLKSKKPA